MPLDPSSAAAEPVPPLPPHPDRHMTGAAWALFAAMGVIWGMPYLFIKIAVDQLEPATVVLGRTSIAALLLLPLAVRAGALRPALAAWRWVLVFALLEMAGPWLLLTHAEERISSGLAGLLLATVPIVGAVVTRLLGDTHALSRVRVAGLVTGVAGVGLLVGIDAVGGHVDALSLIEMLLVAVGYAVAPIILVRRMSDVPSLGIITLSLTMVAALSLPWGVAVSPPPAEWAASTAWSVLALAVICTALAFVLFFALIARVGPVRATVITFVNPAVAVLLGLVVLDEPLTAGMLVGFPLVLLGSYLATRPSRPTRRQPAGAAVSSTS
jgi:drug/metabolite transporter (DMT)-like permease